MTRAPIPDLTPGEHRLEGAVAHYLARVLRLRAGDAFVAFDPATAREADAVTVWTDQETITVRFGPLRAGHARAPHSLTWVQGLAKGDKCDAVVRDATELGATRVMVATTRRSVVKLDAAKATERQARWARIASEAARQCGRSDAPLVDVPRPWTDALARAADTGTGDDAVRFCLWEQATDPLAPPLFAARLRVRPRRRTRRDGGRRGALPGMARRVARPLRAAHGDGGRRRAGRRARVERARVDQAKRLASMAWSSSVAAMSLSRSCGRLRRGSIGLE
jgi:16S rRNA (uracil1498-N3)-methyltransferase